MIAQQSTGRWQFIHAADIHLDSPLRGVEGYPDAPVAEIRGATRRALERLVELALAERVAFVLLAGDLFDGDWKDYHTGLFFARQMGQLARAGIRVFIVAGNHDAASRMSHAMPWPENVRVFSSQQPESVALEGLAAVIHGRSYQNQAEAENLARDFPPYWPGLVNIGLLHTSLTGRPGHADYAPCSVGDLLAKGYAYWALGHVHRREVVATDPWVVFAGNLQGRHIREEGAKGVTLVTVVDGRVSEVQECPLDVLRWATCRVDLSDCDRVDTVAATVRQALLNERERAAGRTLAVRLQLTGATAVHPQLLARTAQWAEEFRGLAAGLGELWLEKVQFQTSRRLGPAELFPADTPLADLLASLQQLELDGNTLFALVPELQLLQGKLPPEIESVDDPLLVLSAEKINQLRAEVGELLLARLLQQGRGA